MSDFRLLLYTCVKEGWDSASFMMINIYFFSKLTESRRDTNEEKKKLYSRVRIFSGPPDGTVERILLSSSLLAVLPTPAEVCL